MSIIHDLEKNTIDILEEYTSDSVLQIAIGSNRAEYDEKISEFEKSLENLSADDISGLRKSIKNGITTLEKSLLIQGDAALDGITLNKSIEFTVFGYALLSKQLNILDNKIIAE